MVCSASRWELDAAGEGERVRTKATARSGVVPVVSMDCGYQDEAVADKQGHHVPQRLPQWIHLREATGLAGTSGPVIRPLWRGRLTDVSGWFLGRPE